ncbi:MAG: NTP transferase domain-containing protein [Microthrixaceae bacterium]
MGGRSRRMGRDKATILLDGRPLGIRSVDALRWLGAPTGTATGVLALGATEEQARALVAERVPDTEGHAGPLAAVLGIVDRAAAAGVDQVVTLACDLPDVDEEAVRDLVAVLDHARSAAAVLAEVGGRIAPPNAVWRADRVVEAVAGTPLASTRARRGSRFADLLDLLSWTTHRDVRFGDIDTPDQLACAVRPADVSRRRRPPVR